MVRRNLLVSLPAKPDLTVAPLHLAQQCLASASCTQLIQGAAVRLRHFVFVTSGAACCGVFRRICSVIREHIPESTALRKLSALHLHDAAACPAAQVFDRMSKGVREAPSKALIGELAAQSGDRPEQAFGELL